MCRPNRPIVFICLKKQKDRQMVKFDPAVAYNDLPPLPPPAELETKTVLKRCIEARSALTEMKVAGELIPNQTVLINTIPILEAKDSSEIENIVTTTDKLFQSAFNEGRSVPDAATKEALRYRTALFEGFRSLHKKPLSISTAIEICSSIKDRPMEIRKIPGTTLANDQTGKIVYTPPAGESVILEKLSNWENFLHNDTHLDPLVRMAVSHYQFEAIHPFTDGNGRTGRILNLLFLIHEGLLHQPILYLSRYILANRSEYYSLLLGVTQNADWESWVLFMLDGILATSQWTTEKVASIKSLIDHTKEHVRDRLPKIYSSELVELLFVQPYCRIGNLVDFDIAKRETASNYLKNLCDIGILEERKIGREKLFSHPKFLGLLTNEEHGFRQYT